MLTVKHATFALWALLSAIVAVVATPAIADEHILLTIRLEDDNGVDVTELTLTDLRAMPALSFTTTTNWTSGETAFTGVPLTVLLDTLGVSTGEMQLSALNEYATILPVDDPTNSGAIIAYLMNGEPMAPRDKGPLWLVYNYDSDPMYRTETIYYRSIWHLDQIEISR